MGRVNGTTRYYTVVPHKCDGSYKDEGHVRALVGGISIDYLEDHEIFVSLKLHLSCDLKLVNDE
jgi:hypothetical protein